MNIVLKKDKKSGLFGKIAEATVPIADTLQMGC